MARRDHYAHVVFNGDCDMIEWMRRRGIAAGVVALAAFGLVGCTEDTRRPVTSLGSVV